MPMLFWLHRDYHPPFKLPGELVVGQQIAQERLFRVSAHLLAVQVNDNPFKHQAGLGERPPGIATDVGVGQTQRLREAVEGIRQPVHLVFKPGHATILLAGKGGQHHAAVTLGRSGRA